jgi:dihydroorotate dehydrogenase
MQPFYDASQPYEDNYDHGPFGLFASSPKKAIPKKPHIRFLGYDLALPFGIPAGPLLNGQFVKSAWEWGFALATYKTVRGGEYPCHPFPNVIKVTKKGRVKPGDALIGDTRVKSVVVTKDGITNSFGVPSKEPAVWQKDVRETIPAMRKGNLLILSFMGTKKEGMSKDAYVADFARTCTLARKTGAPVLEVNFSCPNVGKEGLICNDVATSRTILEALATAKGNTPLLVKIGYFAKEEQGALAALLEAIHTYADGVVAINTIQAKVTDRHGRQILPGSPVRLYSGVCGAAIRWAGVEMAARIVGAKKRHGWKDFVVIGVGGVTSAEDYTRYMRLGVDAVQSATGAMWNQRLAYDILSKA